MISVCSASDPECQKAVVSNQNPLKSGILNEKQAKLMEKPRFRIFQPPKCSRKQKKRQLPEEMTIEQRLLRIQELMKLKRGNGTVEVGGARRRTTQMVETEPMSVVNKDYGRICGKILEFEPFWGDGLEIQTLRNFGHGWEMRSLELWNNDFHFSNLNSYYFQIIFEIPVMA